MRAWGAILTGSRVVLDAALPATCPLARRQLPSSSFPSRCCAEINRNHFESKLEAPPTCWGLHPAARPLNQFGSRFHAVIQMDLQGVRHPCQIPALNRMKN